MSRAINYRHRERLGEVAGIVLRVIALAGIIGMMAVAPNCLQLLKVFDRRKRSRTTYRIRKILLDLKRQGLVESKVEKGEKFFTLTAAGETWLEREKLKQQLFDRQNKKWDGYWYLVMFDIKELTRRKRDLLRLELQDFGFIKLQNSVWIAPRPCEEVIELLKTDLMLGKDVLYLKVASISNDGWLRREFDLPQA